MPSVATIGRLVIPLALYVVALCGLLWQIGDHPAFPYNWESYTAWNYWAYWASAPSAADILAITDGLMTDSGRGPLVGALAWLGFWGDGVSLAAMRWPVAAVSALAVPLTWELGRRLIAPPAALIAALLLAVSAVFVLYGRTATLVGVSLVPALLTMLMVVGLLASLTEARRPLFWLIGLQTSLIAGAYAYAPVRLLWPLSVLALLLAAVGRRGNRRPLVGAALMTMAVVPVFLFAVEGLTAGVWSPAAITDYFQVRGEQLLALGDDPARYLPYVRERPSEASDAGSLAWALVQQNTVDMLRLGLDWGTEPVASHYWHPSGQLWPLPLVPFFWLGLAVLVWRTVDSDRRPMLLLFLVAGLTLPLLLTTRVHVGRLVPALPLLFVVVGLGLDATANAVTRFAHGRLAARGSTIHLATTASLGIALVLVSTLATLSGYEHLPTASQESRITARMADLVTAAAARGGAAVVAPADMGAEVEGVRGGTLWLALNREYRLVDLSRPPAVPAAADPLPPLYVVGVLPELAAGTLPNACGNIYLVYADAVTEFHAATASPAIKRECPAGLRFEVLPN